VEFPTCMQVRKGLKRTINLVKAGGNPADSIEWHVLKNTGEKGRQHGKKRKGGEAFSGGVLAELTSRWEGEKKYPTVRLTSKQIESRDAYMEKREPGTECQCSWEEKGEELCTQQKPCVW